MVSVVIMFTSALRLMVISKALFRLLLERFVTQSDTYLSLHRYIMHFRASVILWDRMKIGIVVASDVNPAPESLSDFSSTRVIIARWNLITTWVCEAEARRSNGIPFN